MPYIDKLCIENHLILDLVVPQIAREVGVLAVAMEETVEDAEVQDETWAITSTQLNS